jgi:hypothetical protein
VLLTSDKANKRARNERAVRYVKLLMSRIDNATPPAVASMLWDNSVFRANFLFRTLTIEETSSLSALSTCEREINELNEEFRNMMQNSLSLDTTSQS